MSWWPRRKKVAEEPTDLTLEPLAEALPLPPNSAAAFDELELDDIFNIARNTMWSRETIQWMLNQVVAHRWDGHDCPVYCIPPTFVTYLDRCTPEQLKMLLSTVIKDCVHMGASSEYEDDEVE